MMTAHYAVWAMTTNHFESRAYVLHMRSYTDSRVILELFTQQYGRLGVVARLSKKNKAQFQPFTPSHIQFFGKAGLKTLTDIDVFSGERLLLLGKLSFCGMYVNELMLKLLPEGEVCIEVFNLYERCLTELSNLEHVLSAEQYLRVFEFELLKELGYGLDFSFSLDGQPIKASSFYRYEVENGFRPVESCEAAGVVVAGLDLINMGRLQYSSATTLKAAKTISRVAIGSLLGGKPLNSRALFV